MIHDGKGIQLLSGRDHVQVFDLGYQAFARQNSKVTKTGDKSLFQVVSARRETLILS